MLWTITLLITGAIAVDNGFDALPPMGWRSWPTFGANINASVMEATFAALVNRSRSVDNIPTSLLDLGYVSAGLDDGWMDCQPGGYHNASGWPLVNTTRFPDMAAMNAKARAVGVRPGFYLNGCYCKDHTCTGDECFAGDVAATVAFGFESVKIDACSALKNMTKYEALFNATGAPMELEDCWNGGPNFPEPDGTCPMNFFRVSADLFCSYGAVVSNMIVAAAHAAKGQSVPGCWTHPDMLQVGVNNVPAKGGSGWPFLTPAETRSHFGMWCIMSSPLILGLNVFDDAAVGTYLGMQTLGDSNESVLCVSFRWTLYGPSSPTRKPLA
jgi:alpha-galactosidase